jgi:hypothetical protein
VKSSWGMSTCQKGETAGNSLGLGQSSHRTATKLAEFGDHGPGTQRLSVISLFLSSFLIPYFFFPIHTIIPKLAQPLPIYTCPDSFRYRSSTSYTLSLTTTETSRKTKVSKDDSDYECRRSKNTAQQEMLRMLNLKISRQNSS